MYPEGKVKRLAVRTLGIASPRMLGFKEYLKRFHWLVQLLRYIRIPYRVIALHSRMARAQAPEAAKQALGVVNIHPEQERGSDVELKAHPMRMPLFTLARIPGREKKIFRATYSDAERRYTVCFVRSASCITFVNSYAEIPEPVLQRIVHAILRRFVWTSSIRSQRNLTNYTFMRSEIMDEYIADLRRGLEAYRTGLGKKTRYNTRYYWERLQADFLGITLTTFGRGDLSLRDFAHFVDLVEQRYPGNYWRGFLLAPVFGLFRDNVVGLIVRNQGVPIAFNIFYLHGNEMIFTGNIFDFSYEKYSLGFITTYQSIIYASSLGIDRVILGGGDFGYKSRLSNSSSYVYECSL